jgi:hypothetical protein
MASQANTRVTRHLFPQTPFQQRQDPITPSTTDERLSNLEPQTPEGGLLIPFRSCHRYPPLPIECLPLADHSMGSLGYLANREEVPKLRVTSFPVLFSLHFNSEIGL